MKLNRVIVCLIVICVIVLAALLRGNVKTHFYIPGAGFSLETTDGAK